MNKGLMDLERREGEYLMTILISGWTVPLNR